MNCDYFHEKLNIWLRWFCEVSIRDIVIRNDFEITEVAHTKNHPGYGKPDKTVHGIEFRYLWKDIRPLYGFKKFDDYYNAAIKSKTK